jgi:hypothetical protein
MTHDDPNDLDYWLRVAAADELAVKRRPEDEIVATRTKLCTRLGELAKKLGGQRIVEMPHARTGWLATRKHRATYRSVGLWVAQFFADQALDEVHVALRASSRATPVDICGVADRDVNTCEHCGEALRGVDLDRDLWETLVPALEPFCREGAGVGETRDYRCYAIARVTDGGIELEQTAGIVRPWADLPRLPAELLAAPPRALEVALATRGDRDGLGVLADVLVDAGDPRGAALAHGAVDYWLARTWLGWLDRRVPRSGLVLRDGVPDSIGLYIDGELDELDRDERLAFAFGPAVRFLPRSHRAIWPALAPARALLSLDQHALIDLANHAEPFAAAELELAMFDQPGAVLDAFALARAKLPALRVLRLVGGPCVASWFRAHTDVLDGVTRLEVAVASDNAVEHVASVNEWRKLLPVAVAMFDADTERASGWCVEPDGAIRSLGVHPTAHAGRLAWLERHVVR